MKKQRITSFIFVSMLLISGFAIGQETTDFTRNSEDSNSFDITLEGGTEDAQTKITFPSTEVVDASFVVSASTAGDTETPEGIHLSLDNYHWKYDGEGYGRLGHQEKFSTDSKSASVNLPDGLTNSEISIMLPSNAVINEAEMTLTGLPYGSGELEDYMTGSRNTNGGSVSYEPDIEMVNDDYYAIWIDRGNLDEQSSINNNILLKHYDGTSWDDTIVIRNDLDTLLTLSNTVLSGSDSIIYGAWIAYTGSDYIELVYSDNEGDSWTEPKTTDLGDGYVYSFDMVIDSSNNLHVVWEGLSEIYYSKSTDQGDTWSNEIEISDCTDGCYRPKLAVDGNYVHIVWEEYSSSDSYYSTQYSSSSNSGDSFSSPTKLSGDNTVSTVTVISEGDYVDVGWIEVGSSTESESIIKSRQSTNNGNNFNSEVIVSSSTGKKASYLDSTNDDSGNFYFSWKTIDSSGNNEIMASRSANSGTSWNTAVNVDGRQDDVYRNYNAIVANSDRIIAIWSDSYDGEGASTDSDIFISISNDDGSTWSSLESLSEHYYEANSYSPSLSYSDDFLYLCYLDGGDLNQDTDPTGNDAGTPDLYSNDGDVFFTRSDDNGENWDFPTVISNFASDGETDIDYAGTTLTYRADISSSSSNVYIAWTDISKESARTHSIYFSSSNDYGVNWNEPIKIDDSSTGSRYGVSIASNGDNVVAVWLDSIGENGDYDIYGSYSTDGGETWIGPVGISKTAALSDYMPEIVYNDGKFHVIWSDSTIEESIHYSFSENNGASWSDEVYLNGETSWYSYMPTISADGSNLYATWIDYGDYDGDATNDYDIIGAVSRDNGLTWDDEKLFVNTKGSSTYTLPIVSSGSGFLYVAYQDTADEGGYDYFFTFSQDEGTTWSDSFEITDNDSETLSAKYRRMDAIVEDKVYFAFLEESQIDSGEEHKDIDVYIRTTLSDDYPMNPAVQIGSSKEWQWSGELNKDNSPVTWKETGGDQGEAVKSFKKALSDELKRAIDDGETIIDDYGIEMTEIVMTITSDTKGTVGFDKLQIHYDADLLVDSEDLTNALNNLIIKDDNVDGDEYNTVATIKINSEASGTLTLDQLSIITADADLSLSDLSVSGELIEGNDVTLTTFIENDGVGDAGASIEFRYDDFLIKSINVNGIQGGGEKVQVTVQWENIPEGQHIITAEIVSSEPEDVSQGSEDTVSTSVTISDASPLIQYTFSFDELLLIDKKVEWTVILTNEGERGGEITTYIYENDDSDTKIYESFATEIKKDGIRKFSSTDENDEWGSWIPTKGVDHLYIVIEDSKDGILLSEEIDISINYLPDLVVTKIEWVDSENNSLLTFSDGTIAIPKIYIMNQGTFDVTSTILLRVTKPLKDLQNNFAGVIEPGFGIVDLPGGVETLVTFNSKLPEIKFFSGGTPGFTGEWDIEILMNNIVSSELTKEEEQKLWDSEELEFFDNKQTVNIVTPPIISIDKFTSSSLDINEGQAVTFTVLISNEGGAEATGKINLLQATSKLRTENFTVDGFASVEVLFDYSVPQGYDGELILKISLDRNSVYPPLSAQDVLNDDFKTLIINVEGTVNVKPAETNNNAGDLIVPVAGLSVILAGLGGAGYYFMGRGVKDELEEAFGNLENQVVSEQTPPAAPPQAEQTPPAAPPQAEQTPPAAPPQAEQTPPAAIAPAPTVFNVTVPPGTQPGQQMQIKAPDGRVVTVTIPAGLQPGAQFQIKI